VLRRESGEFAEIWERHEVAKRFEDHKVLVHPQLGEIEVDCQALFTEDQSQALLVLTAPPRTEAFDKLHLLGVLGTEKFVMCTFVDTAATDTVPSRVPLCARHGHPGRYHRAAELFW